VIRSKLKMGRSMGFFRALSSYIWMGETCFGWIKILLDRYWTGKNIKSNSSKIIE